MMINAKVSVHRESVDPVPPSWSDGVVGPACMVAVCKQDGAFLAMLQNPMMAAKAGAPVMVGATEDVQQQAQAPAQQPTYVNPKQYHRIMARRKARARLEAHRKTLAARKVGAAMLRGCAYDLYIYVRVLVEKMLLEGSRLMGLGDPPSRARVCVRPVGLLAAVPPPVEARARLPSAQGQRGEVLDQGRAGSAGRGEEAGGGSRRSRAAATTTTTTTVGGRAGTRDEAGGSSRAGWPCRAGAARVGAR